MSFNLLYNGSYPTPYNGSYSGLKLEDKLRYRYTFSGEPQYIKCAIPLAVNTEVAFTLDGRASLVFNHHVISDVVGAGYRVSFLDGVIKLFGVTCVLNGTTVVHDQDVSNIMTDGANRFVIHNTNVVTINNLGSLDEGGRSILSAMYDFVVGDGSVWDVPIDDGWAKNPTLRNYGTGPDLVAHNFIEQNWELLGTVAPVPVYSFNGSSTSTEEYFELGAPVTMTQGDTFTFVFATTQKKHNCIFDTRGDGNSDCFVILSAIGEWAMGGATVFVDDVECLVGDDFIYDDGIPHSCVITFTDTTDASVEYLFRRYTGGLYANLTVWNVQLKGGLEYNYPMHDGWANTPTLMNVGTGVDARLIQPLEANWSVLDLSVSHNGETVTHLGEAVTHSE